MSIRTVSDHEWYWLAPKDQRFNNWILWLDTPRRIIRDSYQHLVCPICHKVDELQALKLPVETNVHIHSRSDFVGTDDGMICISQRFKDCLVANSITGLDYVTLPDGKYFLIKPCCFLDVDVSLAGFQYDGEPCSACGRYRHGVYVGPLKQSYELPPNPLQIVTPNIGREDGIGRVTWLMGSSIIKKILAENKITGVEFIRPL